MLIDDLTTHGTQEPYRMFTSRAEYRLTLREDNADLRLTETGYNLGLVNETRWQELLEKRTAVEREKQRLHAIWIHPNTACSEKITASTGNVLDKSYRATELLRRPEINHHFLWQLESLASPQPVTTTIAEQVEIQIKYEGYIQRQQLEIERQKKHENAKLPVTLDYDTISGLSAEIKQKLKATKPVTIGQASRISGITPAAISILLIHTSNN